MCHKHLHYRINHKQVHGTIILLFLINLLPELNTWKVSYENVHLRDIENFTNFKDLTGFYYYFFLFGENDFFASFITVIYL